MLKKIILYIAKKPCKNSLTIFAASAAGLIMLLFISSNFYIADSYHNHSFLLEISIDKNKDMSKLTCLIVSQVAFFYNLTKQSTIHIFLYVGANAFQESISEYKEQHPPVKEAKYS